MARVVTRDRRRLQERRDGRRYVVDERRLETVMKDAMMKDVLKVMTRDVARVVIKRPVKGRLATWR